MRCQTRSEQRLAADCLQRPLRSRFRQRLKAGVMPLEENTLAHWFFDVLYKNHEFCQELGRLVLAAGKFETVLKQYLSEKGISVDEKRATMGSLVNRLKEHNYTSNTLAKLRKAEAGLRGMNTAQAGNLVANLG